MKPMYQVIADEIAAKIDSGEYGDGYRLPNEMELMESYDVSRVTMRKAMSLLTGSGKVYRISGKGTFVGVKPAMSAASTKLIGVILCNFTASYGTELLKSLERCVTAAGYTMLFVNSYYDRDTESKAIRTLVDAGAKGIVIQPVHHQVFSSEIMRLSLTGYPFVLIDRDLQGLNLPFVGSDNSAAIHQAMDFLFARGHKNICMFTPIPEKTSTIEERVTAFVHSFIDNSVFNSDYTFSRIRSPLLSEVTDEDIARDIALIEDYLTAHPDITCAFASEYGVARMIRTAAKNLGKEIPDDLSLITFDNHNDRFRKNSTTFIRQREGEIGRKAVELLLGLIAGGTENKKYLIDADIIDNGSVKDISASE